jgi:peptidoglycan/xylan/chitin deacetylase (PgdA/CDA1 family)
MKTGTGSRRTVEREVRLPVLLYHHIGDPRLGTHPSLTVPRPKFEAQLRWLVRRRFIGVSSLRWFQWLSEGRPLPPRPILLTFDDGYADLAETALPVLETLGWSATVFIAASTVDDRNAWDEPGASAHRILSADEIRAWAARGIEFGAHGATHCDLTRVDDERLRQEVVGGRDALAELLGRPVTAFAYPYGAHNAAVREVVANSFEVAFGVEEGINDAETDRTRLRRTMVQPGDTVFDLVLRTRLGWSPLQRVRARLRMRERARQLGDRITPPGGGRRRPQSSPPSRQR